MTEGMFDNVSLQHDIVPHLNDDTLRLHKQWFDDAPVLDLSTPIVMEQWGDFLRKFADRKKRQNSTGLLGKPGDVHRHWFFVLNFGGDGFALMVAIHYMVSNISRSTPQAAVECFKTRLEAIGYALQHFVAFSAREIGALSLDLTTSVVHSESQRSKENNNQKSLKWGADI